MVKNPPANAGGSRDVGLIPGSGRFPGLKWQPAPLFMRGEFHGQRSLTSYYPRGHKELKTTE